MKSIICLFRCVFLFSVISNAEVIQHFEYLDVSDTGRLPSGLAFNSHTQLIVCTGAGSTTDELVIFDSTGTVVRSFASHGTNYAEFKWPAYVDVDGQDRIWVTDNQNHRLQVFDSTGAFLFTYGSQGNATNQFNYPRGIAIEGDDLYVSDSDNFRVQKFHISGDTVNWVTNWGSEGPFSGEFGTVGSFETPMGGIDVSGTNVYVVDGGNNRIQVFDINGTYLRKWGEPGTEYGQFNRPLGLKIDSQKRIWTTEMKLVWGRVQTFDENNQFLFALDDPLIFEELSDIYDVAFHPDGRVFISEMSNNKIHIFGDGQPHFVGVPSVKVGKEQQEMSFTIFAEDPNDNALFYSMSNAPPGATLYPVNGTNIFSWVPGAGDAGVYQVAFHVYDNGSPVASDYSVVAISISNTNHSPTIATSLPFSPYPLLEGQNLQFNIILYDKDYDSLTLVSNAFPEGALISQMNTTNFVFSWTPNFNQGSIAGTDYNMTFWVVDNGTPNLSNSVSVTITVSGTNDPPRLAPLNDTYVQENETVSFNVIASDPNGDNLIFAVSNAPAGYSFSQINSTNYMFSWVTDFTDAGIYSNVEFYVTDDSITPATAVERINIIVSNVNRMPYLEIDNVIIEEGSNWVMSVIATDPDTDDVLTYAAENMPVGVMWTNYYNMNYFEWTPGYDESGFYPDWKVIVNDGYMSVTDTFSVTVIEVNDPPVLGTLTNWIIGEGQLLMFPLHASDTNDDILSFSISNAPPDAVVTNITDTEYFYWVPGYYCNTNVQFVYVTVTEINEFGWSDSGSFTIAVTNVNRPPELSLPDAIISEGSNWTMAIIAQEPDTNDVLYYLLENIQGDAIWTAKNGTNFIEWIPGYDESGFYPDWKVIVNDGYMSVTDTFSVTVTEVNDPPVLGTLTNWIIGEGQLLMFPLHASDTNDDILSFSISNAPPDAVVTNITDTEYFYWVPGYYCNTNVQFVYVTVTEINEFGWSDSGSFTIAVTNVNRHATWSPPNDSYFVNEGETLLFTISATDYDTNDNTAVTARGVPENAIFGLATEIETNKKMYEFSWLPDYSQAGTYSNLTFILTENSVTVSLQEVRITVMEGNSAPDLSGSHEIYGIENQEISFAITGTAHYSYPVRFNITNVPWEIETYISNNIYSIYWTPSLSEAGYYTDIVVYAYEDFPDRQPEIAAFSLSIVITNVNHAPKLENIESKTWYAGNTYNIQLSATENDIDDQLTFTIENNPQGMLIDPEIGIVTWQPLQNQQGMYSNITFTVTDNGGRAEMPGSRNMSASVFMDILVKGSNEPPEVVFQRETPAGWQPMYGSAEVYAKQLIRLRIPKVDINNDELTLIENELILPEGAFFDTNKWIISWIPKNSQSTESGREIRVKVRDNGDPPQTVIASLNVIVHELPEEARVKDNEFYDIDGDKVSIKYKSKYGGVIDIGDPKNIKISGGNGKENLIIKTGKSTLPEQSGDSYFDVEKIESDTALKKIKIKGNLSGLSLPEVNVIVLDGDLTGEIVVYKNISKIVAKRTINNAEIWCGTGTTENPDAYECYVKKILAKEGIEKSIIMVGLPYNSNPTNTLSIGQLKKIKTDSLNSTTIATGLPTNKKGVSKTLKIKAKETSNSILFKTKGNTVIHEEL